MTDTSDTEQEGRKWVWCGDCGPRAGLELNLPNRVLCRSCGRQVGETADDVENEMAVLRSRYQIVVDAETDEPITGVEWDTDRTEVSEIDD